MELQVGQVIDGKYKVVRLIGKGGMGSVYAGEHLVIGRQVAVKVLHTSAADDQEIIKRFEREAQAAARIGNDHIMDVLDVGSLADGSRYMICELLDGETLATRLERQQRLVAAELVPITRQLLNGLGAAHTAGVIHRDLKPDNIFLLRHKAGWADFVKIIDFGISKFQPLSGDEGMSMTATGTVLGTPYYLSPEQARGMRDTDGRSDLYSVGVILYQAVTGRLPFEAENFNELLFKIALEKPVPPHELSPDVDRGFSEIILKAMARDPGDRFESAAKFCEALEQWAISGGISLSGPIVTNTGANRAFSSQRLALPANPTPSTWGGTGAGSALYYDQGKSRRKLLLSAGAVLLLGAIAVAVYATVHSAGRAPAESASASATASAMAATQSQPIAPEPVRTEPVQPVAPLPTPPEPQPESDAGSAPSAAEKKALRPTTTKKRPPAAPRAAASQQPTSPKRNKYDYGY